MPSKTPPTLPEDASHADILAAVRLLGESVNLQAMTLQRVETKVDDVRKCIGDEGEDERGAKVGTGIRGRLMRLEDRVDRRFDTFDDWRNYAVGALAAGSILIAAVWWIIQDKVGHLLK